MKTESVRLKILVDIEDKLEINTPIFPIINTPDKNIVTYTYDLIRGLFKTKYIEEVLRICCVND